MAKYGMILLAAGGSSRMGFPKQLLNFGGKPLIRHSTETALASVCRPVVAVIGSRRDQMRAALDGLPVDVVENSSWEQGMGTSIRAGMSYAATYGLDGIILALADQPLVPAETYHRLVAAHCMTGAPIVAARSARGCGTPLLVGRELFPRLMQLEGDQGPQHLLQENGEGMVWVGCPEAEHDIDLPHDYDRARAELTRRSEPQRASAQSRSAPPLYSQAVG
jgi:molybdenum cofactor cytidylyltransferase